MTKTSRDVEKEDAMDGYGMRRSLVLVMMMMLIMPMFVLIHADELSPSSLHPHPPSLPPRSAIFPLAPLSSPLSDVLYIPKLICRVICAVKSIGFSRTIPYRIRFRDCMLVLCDYILV